MIGNLILVVVGLLVLGSLAYDVFILPWWARRK